MAHGVYCTRIGAAESWVLQEKCATILEITGGWSMDREGDFLDLRPIKNGWAAVGTGWAVHGETEEEAVRLYHEAIERHKEIDARPTETTKEFGSVARRD